MMDRSALSEEGARFRNVSALASLMWPNLDGKESVDLSAADGDGRALSDHREDHYCPLMRRFAQPRTGAGGNRSCRILGCLTAGCIGDALGSNTEFMSMDAVARKYGVVKRFLHSSRRPLGAGTDDSESLLALARAVALSPPVSGGPLDETFCVREIVAAFIAPPQKGYGPTSSVILTKLASGEADPVTSGTMFFPEGSVSNGGLLRAGPVGLRHALGQSKNESLDEILLSKDITAATRCTHSSAESLEACLLFSKLVVLAVQDDDDCGLFPLIERVCLSESARNGLDSEYLRSRLTLLARELPILMTRTDVGTETPQAADRALLKLLISDLGDEFGELFAIRVSDALAVALLVCALADRIGPACALVRTVNWGGDADSVACIAGQLLGAYHGTAWIPAHFLERLEVRNACVEIADMLQGLGH